MFSSSLNKDQLQNYVARQLYHFFPDEQIASRDALFTKAISQALERVEFCFSHISLRSYHYADITYFSHLHSDQYTSFLWFLSNEVWKLYGDDQVASKLFYLNKTLNGVVCMYDNVMPNVFLIVHGGDIVLGKATYDEYLVVYQGSTVGAVNGIYPALGKGIALAPHSMTIGDCNVGDYTTIGNKVFLRNMDIPSYSLVYNDIKTSQLSMKKQAHCWAQTFFNVKI